MGGPADQCWEDSQNGLPALPGDRDTVGSGVQEEDDGGGTNIPGAAEGTGRVWGMREGDGSGIVGTPQDDTAWADNRGAMELGSLDHGRRPADVLAVLPDQGRAAELPYRGLPRTGRDKDSNADEFLQPACPGYHDHIGGGKPPTPKVLTMRHAGPMVGAKW